MRILLSGLALAAAASFAAPAYAAVTLSVDTGGTTTTSASCSGYNCQPVGNVRTWTTSGITLNASAWSLDKDADPDKIVKSFLGQYSGGGLGVTASNESGSPQHTVDNYGRVDFVLLQFSSKVSLTGAWFTPFDVAPTGMDSDASVYYDNNEATPFNISHNMVSTDFYDQLGGPIPLIVNGNQVDDAGYRAIDPNGTIYSQVWVVSAPVKPDADGTCHNGCYDTYDAFKLKKLKFEKYVAPPPPPVPEPATWAMMISGFGFVGASLRRRRARPSIA